MSYLPELRSSLVRAAHRQREIASHQRLANRPAASRRRGARTWLGALPVLLSVAVTVAIVAVALVVIRPGHSTPATSAAGKAPTSLARGPRPLASSCQASATAGGAPVRQAGPPDAQVMATIGLLRRAPGPQDTTLAACQAARRAVSNALPSPQAARYFVGADPAYVRYVGPGPLGGQVFMYALPGLPTHIASSVQNYEYPGMPSNPGFLKSLTQPSVCLI